MSTSQFDSVMQRPKKFHIKQLTGVNSKASFATLATRDLLVGQRYRGTSLQSSNEYENPLRPPAHPSSMASGALQAHSESLAADFRERNERMRVKLEAEQKKRRAALNKGIFKHQLHNADEFTK